MPRVAGGALVLFAGVSAMAVAVASYALPSNVPTEILTTVLGLFPPTPRLEFDVKTWPLVAANWLEPLGVSPEFLLWLAAWPHFEKTLWSFLGLVCLVLCVYFGHKIVAYKRERDVEVSPPAVRFCDNKMTLEEYEDKTSTYSALAELMQSPEFLELKEKRASEGASAWNWQSRAASGATELTAETDSEEELLSSSASESSSSE